MFKDRGQYNSRMSVSPRPATLGDLKTSIAHGQVRRRSVKDEVRQNLIDKLRREKLLQHDPFL